MARIAGVDLPRNKRMEIALTYIYGIGRSAARKICAEAGVDRDAKTDDLTDDEVVAHPRESSTRDYKVEGDLRREVALNIKRCWTSAATAACATGGTCRCAASARTPTRAPARARGKTIAGKKPAPAKD